MPVYPTDPRATILNPSAPGLAPEPTVITGLTINGGFPLVGLVPVVFQTDCPAEHGASYVVVDGQVVHIELGDAPSHFLWDTGGLAPGARNVSVYVGKIDCENTGRYARQVVTPSPVAGPLAASFDGSSWLEAATSAALSPNQPVTFACWVYLNSVSADQWIAGKGNSGGTFEWILHFSTTLGFRCAIDVAGSTEPAWTGTAPVAGQWYHVAFTLSAGTLTVYQNGVAGSVNTSCSGNFTHSNAYDLTLGRSLDGLEGLSGRIDEPGLWSSLKDITSLYNGGAAKRFATLSAADLTNLVAFWDMSTSAFADATGNGHAYTAHGNVPLVTGVA